MNNLNFKFDRKSKSITVWVMTILAIIYLIGVISLLISAIKAIILFKNNILMSSILIMAMCVIALIYTLDIVLWQIVGKEEIEITDNELKVRQYGRIFSKKRIIQIGNIQGIFERKYSAKGINKFWFPSKQGKLKISNTQKDIFIGRNIDKAETQAIIHRLQSKLSNNITISIIDEIRDYSTNEIMFYIWVVSSIAVFLPAYIWVPFFHDYEKLEREVRLSYLEENYSKKYCYQRVACWESAEACILDFCDSTHINLYYEQCDISDAEAYEICGDSTIKYFTPKRIMPNSSTGRFRYCGIIYVISKQDSIYLAYSNRDLYNPFFVHARYVHDSMPDDMDEFHKTSRFTD